MVARRIVLVLTTLVCLAANDRDVNSEAAPGELFKETFDGGELGAEWSWVREEPGAWELSDDGVLHMRPLAGTLWEADNSGRNILLRATPEAGEGGLVVEVTVSDASEGEGTKPGLYEQPGVLWYRDDDNYVKLCKEFYDGKWWVVLGSERGGKAKYAQAELTKDDGDPGPVRLRLVASAEGGKVSGFFRHADAAEGRADDAAEAEWQRVGEFDLPAADGGELKLGLFAHGSVDDPARRSAFDDFTVSTAP